MSRRSVYDALKVKPGQETQMSAFIHQTNIRIYEAEIRRQLEDNGYPPMFVRLRDERALRDVQGISTRAARSIRVTYNRMLRNAINRLPKRISTDSEVKRLIGDGYLKRAREYNTTALNPWLRGKVVQLARQHFMERNGIQCKWEITGGPPSQLDVCARDIDLGVQPDLGSFEASYPAHPNCTHLATPVDVQPGPPAGSVWYGV